MKQQHWIKAGVIALVVAVAMVGANGWAAKKEKPAPKISLKDCPAAVQKTVKAKVGNAPIVDIEKDTEDGDTEYTVTIKKNGKECDLSIGADGEFRGMEETIALKDCPAAVQKTIKTKAGAATITEITKSTDDDGVEYDVTIKQDSEESDFSVDADGKLVDSGDEEIALKDCPAAVQDTVKAKAGDAPVVSIEKDTDSDGDTEYTVTIKKDGKEVDLAIGADGEYRGIEEEVELQDCPAAVQETIKAKAGAATIEAITKTTDDDGVEYGVTIKQGDKERDFSVEADGKFAGWEDEDTQ